MDDLNNTNNSNLGGKANSLIKLKQLGLPVPDFFVIPASYFKEYTRYNGIFEEIEQLLKESKYDEIKKKVMNGIYSEEMTQKILAQLEKNDFQEYSVRSSANNEDGKIKSFAGQYETFLNVKKENIFNAIKKCWLSILEDNVISYIGERINIYSINVIIQKMINPELAGVAFSVDPTSRSKNYSIIEMCEGVGEKLVSGQTTPTKLVIRRDSMEVDLKLGNIQMPINKVKELEKYILYIEQEYGHPIDMEWCYLDQKLFILQARPITAYNYSNIPFKKSISREKKLFELEIYYKGEYFGIKELTYGRYYFNPLFEVCEDYFTNIYYDCLSLEQLPTNMLREVDKNYEMFEEKYNNIKISCEYLKNVINGNQEFELEKFVDELIKIQPFSSLGNLIGQNWECSDRIKKLLTEYRNEYDKIIYNSTDYMSNKVLENLPDKYKEYINVISLDELKNIGKVKIDTLEKRKNGYVYYNGQIKLKDFSEFCEEKDFSIISNVQKGDIKGDVAYGGIVKGTVKIILNIKDFTKFKEGDILVTSMTTPKFTSIMQIASGIITDEGGVTCHASIIARELKKPCIVGCKNATEVLKDGMRIELDAISGIVKIEH